MSGSAMVAFSYTIAAFEMLLDKCVSDSSNFCSFSESARCISARVAFQFCVTSPNRFAVKSCATSGGIQALRNFGDVEDFKNRVYSRPEFLDTLKKSTPISDHIRVDYELRGCPINKHQLLETISALINHRRPTIPSYSVCIECKRKGNICVAVAHGAPCLGPVTMAGCGAICPTFHRGCYVCFGPKENPNTESLSRWWSDRFGMKAAEIMRAYRTFNANAEPFRRESESHEA